MATSIRRSKSLAVSVERRAMCRVEARDMASGEPKWPVPMRAIGAQNLLTLPGGVTIAGYLHKRGGKQLQLFKWPLRYVIIHKGCVYYFKCSTSSSSQGAFSLNGYNRVMRAAEETTSNNVFPFKMVHISKKHRTWYFSAASEEERKKWMLALRTEIDHYHEKKETTTDLSESGSDSGSFYGSVERAVAIKYEHNPAEDSWQDEDDDEEDYERPDSVDDGAPSYPPPPVPVQAKAEDPHIRRSISSIAMSKPLPSLPKMEISDLHLPRPRRESVGQNKIDIDMKPPPPIPSFPPAHKPPPPPPITSSATDRGYIPPQRPRKPSSGLPISPNSTFQPPSSRSDPPPPRLDPPSARLDPPPPRLDPLPPRLDPSVTSSRKEPPNCITTDEMQNISQNSIMGNNLLKQELSNIFKKPPPLVPSKPAVPAIEKLPNKPGHPAPPVPPVKPSYLKVEDNTPPIVPRNKPRVTINDDKSPERSSSQMKSGPAKPPPVVPRVRPPRADHGFSQMMRSPPDGQSFIDKTVESPVRPSRLKDLHEESDSDDEYEKVSLPPSVFVDTCESTDVERMFKAMDITGNPLNGLFCIRNSAKAGKVIVVWDNHDAKIRNYRIFEQDTKVYLEVEIRFSDIADLVEHYYKSPLPGHNTLVLKHAYGCMINPR
ncbi:SH3 domain-binding protein 2 isoform X2 [Rana temporaria]|uniref:SH3 domain-binding protein 2 isoform X2 n=1 Tax=Rana temporaria TaxID=8407 RepID=UPI001AAD581E|nr:SH3 domain-binding protein 2 isoform X2 [Rana temporaria]